MSNFETVSEILANFKDELDFAIEHLNSEYDAVRVGRANPKILDRVLVDYYGSKTPLNQMANITVPDARMLQINVWDLSAFRDVLKAINEANLGLAPSDDGKVIRLVFPAMTEERRKEVAKQVKKLAEETKIAIRNLRKSALDDVKNLKKDNVITEDEVSVAEKDVQKYVDSYNEKVDLIATNKEKDVMSV